ncbi:MAG: ABC transporter permease [Micromonosporaceae bacterium]|nr:ABC transporter permease [Micromonosporaceae bacterium]
MTETETSVRDDRAGARPAEAGWAGYLSERPLLVLGAVLALLVVVTVAIEPGYLSVRGVRNTLLLAAPVGILAAAQTVLMLTRGIDISVAMVATLAGYVVGSQAGTGLAYSIVVGLLVGALIGAVNGVGVGVFRVHPLIMTLAMSAILLGLLSQWAPTIFRGVTAVPPFLRTVGGGSFAGHLIPYNALVWAAVAVVVILGLRRSGLGRMIYAVGDNPTAARLAGVREWQVLLVVYAISGLLAAVAGVLIAGQVGSVDLRLAEEFLLPSVAAAVIGGTSLFGGVGSYSGTIFGALILGVLNTMLTFLNATQAMKQVVFGVIVLGLAWAYAAAQRRTG